MRAFAVLAVLCYHGGTPWIGGGLLGVDLFFVLSGFLITSLLCRELVRTHTVRLGRFWAQRARRLLPALLITLIGVAFYCVLFRNTVDLGFVRGDALSTLLYVANWHFVFADQGYFAQNAAPSPLLHTWSLAVEEQYYLVWPLVALLVVRRFGVRALAITAGALAVASALLMAALHVGGASVDRLYYGTDTRAQALLVGSFLGAIGSHGGTSFSIVPQPWRASGMARRGWAALGLVGAGLLLWAWHTFDGQNPSLYRGGFFVVALAGGAVIVGCVTVPGSVLARFLSLPALVFVGRISYGLYLYHWPIFLTINHARTGIGGFPLFVVRLVVTFAVASASFVLVEEPIRTRTAFRGRKGLGITAVAATVTALTVVAATVTPSAVAAPLRPAPLPPAERRALTASYAYYLNPVKFMILGDSVALTLGIGLSQDSIRNYGVGVLNHASIGCDLDRVDVRIDGVAGYPTIGCADWPAAFTAEIKAVKPDVVGVLLGKWEVTDHYWHGHWVHVGDPAWDRHLLSELVHLSDLVSAGGANVALFTCPYVDSYESLGGSIFPENDPARIVAWNRIVDEAAALRSGTTSVIDLNRLLDPNGRYSRLIDGYAVRTADGIHITPAGGELVQRAILPTIVQLGLAAPVRRAQVIPTKPA